MCLPLVELMKSRMLHLLPHVSFTCLALDWWFFGFVIIQHNTRTSLDNCHAFCTSLSMVVPNVMFAGECDSAR